MLAAKREPSFFKRIVMIAPAPCYVSHPDYAAGFSQEDIDALLDHIGDDYMAWIAAFAPVAVGDVQQQDVVDDFQRSLTAMRPDIALTMARIIFSMDLRAQLDGFDTPATIIQPSGDPVVAVSVGHYLAQRWPQAQLEIIKSAGHLPHLTAPQKVIEVLERILD
jgi:pimeloyl-ACP methyl ester carboxylesterase